jgi:hypothetical protein
VGNSRDCDDKIVMPCDSEELITVSVLLLLAVHSLYESSVYENVGWLHQHQLIK